jgi:hypothetical protein
LILDLENIYTVGDNSFFDSVSPNGLYGVVFDDNTETGYFYALDIVDEQNILDALHIYNVHDVIDKHKPSKIQIAWTEDGQIASLLINSYCHAIFDFKERAGYCRNAFPDSKTNWALIKNRLLNEELIQRLF